MSPRDCSLPLITFFGFHYRTLFSSLVMFLPRYFILFFLMFLSLPFHINVHCSCTTEFCMLTLYPSNLLIILMYFNTNREGNSFLSFQFWCLYFSVLLIGQNLTLWCWIEVMKALSLVFLDLRRKLSVFLPLSMIFTLSLSI